MPFDALKGLHEELRRREEMHSRMERKELSETQQEEINSVLTSLKPGDKIKMTYYASGKYVTVEDVFVKIDMYKKIIVSEEREIFSDDIFFISLV